MPDSRFMCSRTGALAASVRRCTTSSEPDWHSTTAGLSRQNAASSRANMAQSHWHYTETGLRLLRVEAPDIALAQVREPHRPVPHPHRIASRTHPLLHHLVLLRVDFRKRNLEN